jgi:2-keto-4-pentenoate hydratase/2-oxohepta-3-ene-1,7-dioic acid hydratase in catechol pathway
MRFMRFQRGDAVMIAVQMHGSWRALPEGGTGPEGSLAAALEDGGLAALAGRLQRGEVVDADKVRALVPLPSPGKIVCVGLNYADHTAESGYVQPEHPTFFARFASSLVAAGDPIVRPRVSEMLDFEGELVAIIGRRGRCIPRAEALDYVAAYSIFNDASVRDFQHRTPQWTLGKNFDGTGAFGPILVTADELPAGASGLAIETRLNGEILQRASTSQLIFDVATLVSGISEAMTLEPGDVVVTGTPSGVGHARKPPLYMRAGDICEVEVEGIGVLRNPIEDEAAPAREAAA